MHERAEKVLEYKNWAHLQVSVSIRHFIASTLDNGLGNPEDIRYGCKSNYSTKKC